MNYTLLSLEGDKDMDIGIVENKLISLLQFPFCSNRSKYGEINSENWRKICKTKLGLVLVSVIHFPFPVLYIHSTYMQQKYKLRPQTSTNCQARLLLLSAKISEFNFQSLNSETKGAELTLKSQCTTTTTTTTTHP